MSTRDSFEAWYALQDQSEPEPEKAYELFESGREELIKDCLFHGWQAATSRQEAKIKALRNSLTWALSNISEEHYGWPSEEDADAHNAAIAAAKETS